MSRDMINLFFLRHSPNAASPLPLLPFRRGSAEKTNWKHC